MSLRLEGEKEEDDGEKEEEKEEASEEKKKEEVYIQMTNFILRAAT